MVGLVDGGFSSSNTTETLVGAEQSRFRASRSPEQIVILSTVVRAKPKRVCRGRSTGAVDPGWPAEGLRPDAEEQESPPGARLGFEILADHVVHVDEHLHHLGHERRRTVHRPGDQRGIALRHKGELGGVVTFERLEKIQLDENFRRLRVKNFHAARADIFIAVPRIDRALAARRAAIAAPHCRILVLVRRP